MARRISPPIIGLLLASLLLVVLVIGSLALLHPPKPQVVTTQIGNSKLGGPFKLIDQTGTLRDQSLLQGKWTAVFFGYTFCPDVCPASLQVLSQAQALLGKDAGKFQIVFISVDPRRDNPQRLAEWIRGQQLPADTHVTALTGDQAAVDQAVKAYDVVASVPDAKADYEVQHSVSIYLMNPKGEFEQPLLFTQPPSDVADQIRAAMQGA